MIGLAALCLAGALGVALLLLLAARATGWRRRRIGMLVRPWLLAIFVLLTIGLVAEVREGLAALTAMGSTLAGAWLAVSLAAHLAERGTSTANPSRRWGARIAHAGIAIAMGGLLLSLVFGSTITRSLAPGETLRFNGWTVQLHDVWPAAGDGWAGVAAELRASGGDGVLLLKPEQRSLFDGSTRSQSSMLASGGGTLTADVGPRAADGRWPITLGWTPFLVLIPIGLLVAAVGCLAAMVGPGTLRRRRLRRARLATAWWA